MLTCEYIGHSGFIFETSKHILFFDVAKGVIPQHYINSDKEKTIFISHHHSHHFNKNITALKERIIASLDVPLKGVPNVFFVMESDTIYSHDLKINVFGSTDEGVCFLVDTQEGIIFHAGDYNDWHWNQEVSEEESELSHLKFRAILEDIKGNAIDVACFPCDQRLGPDYTQGPIEFIKELQPKVFVAMHHQLNQSLETLTHQAFVVNPRIKLFIPTQANQKIELHLQKMSFNLE